jgi:ribosome biogenesis GTPase
VEIEVLDEADKKGNINQLLPRENALIRPAVANIDGALVIFALTKPKPNLNLLDRFLVMMERQKIETKICFNKADIATDEEKEQLCNIYEKSGYEIFFISAKEKQGVDEVKKVLHGKTTTVAGPSGVGKSTLINCLQNDIVMETGQISEKIERGKHTTRHSELIMIDKDSYIMDTPGFTSLSVSDIPEEELYLCFPEFIPYEENCRFQGCAHIHEPKCGIKDAVSQGLIGKSRYDNYVLLYEESKGRRRY